MNGNKDSNSIEFNINLKSKCYRLILTPLNYIQQFKQFVINNHFQQNQAQQIKITLQNIIKNQAQQIKNKQINTKITVNDTMQNTRQKDKDEDNENISQMKTETKITLMKAEQLRNVGMTNYRQEEEELNSPTKLKHVYYQNSNQKKLEGSKYFFLENYQNSLKNQSIKDHLNHSNDLNRSKNYTKKKNNGNKMNNYTKKDNDIQIDSKKSNSPLKAEHKKYRLKEFSAEYAMGTYCSTNKKYQDRNPKQQKELKQYQKYWSNRPKRSCSQKHFDRLYKKHTISFKRKKQLEKSNKSSEQMEAAQKQQRQTKKKQFKREINFIREGSRCEMRLILQQEKKQKQRLKEKEQAIKDRIKERRKIKEESNNSQIKKKKVYQSRHCISCDVANQNIKMQVKKIKQINLCKGGNSSAKKYAPCLSNILQQTYTEFKNKIDTSQYK